ncbi:hypothetical protein [Natronobeatus ordinarius]|uniref:hypothetical protein n=1 Tax=Natronobeatus ordinarius TaxID=2963433 RepID=UPI0020CBFF3D|nr:hypothetical protein [Natronobeatus ordinarius]
MTDRSIGDSRLALLSMVLLVGLAAVVGAAAGAGVGDTVTSIVGDDEPEPIDDSMGDLELVTQHDLEPASLEDPADLTCAVGEDTGPVWVTDTGLEVVDDGPGGSPYPEFLDDETVAFGNVTFSTDGPGVLIYEGGTGSVTCISAVDATLRIDPADADAVAIDGAVDALSFGAVDYDSDETDLAYDAPAAFDLTLEPAEANLSDGTEVVATVDGSTLESTVEDGQVTFTLPGGEHDVTFQTEIGLAKYAGDDGTVGTDGLRDAIDDWRSGEIGTDLLRDVIDAWRSGEVVT